MKSWREEDLILHLYGEHPRRDELARDVAVDPELARRFAALARDLAPFDLLEAPEPPAGFEARLWRALRPRLAAERRGRLWEWLAVPPVWRLAALATALVAALGLAFFAGRSSVAPGPSHAELAALRVESTAQERILEASLAAHLESSGLLLTDLVNAPTDGALGEEQRWAATLLASNRLYRRAAERAGQRRIVALLDELEPLLLELAHSPDDGRRGDLQRRIAERDLLFKVRVVGNRLGPDRSPSQPRPHL